MISKNLLNLLLQFRHEREWEQFHSIRNLSAALCVEAAELLAHFRWARDSDIESIKIQHKTEIESELADVTILLLYICHDLGLSIEDAVAKKIEVNRANYPVEKAKGTFTKYDKL
ncbi:nucleotide pyrophosphohydrolase [Desulfoprunum benzoelyticum]|uniref:NTP pyrophosphatase (Non-canonical NTP hydrolase) n=1 Tax=Desulfoprunum benzoelyticum TaxID=1506996 RepID=A0A840UWW0_9BACT|nr:nucleotide pyrophosphohydrolase [Desulfoprunum benzoelyticum]MBB5349423.1 NTP pyrophosphatase (non-canonical NTP hydrolase) [Desulfoprunum benzoelyticum]MBM9531205.1 nucleotide pyrophosphohydrolase [Desulfoprunum benzoelyticum]